MDAPTSSHPLPALESSEEMAALSRYRALEHSNDHRQKRGVRAPWAVMLRLVVLGQVAGMTRLAGSAEWVCLRADWRTAVLPLPRASLPCAWT
jgi:hypothetical protein